MADRSGKGPSNDEPPFEPPQRLLAQFESWCKDLINLTRSNRLVYLRPGAVLEIIEPGPSELYRRLGSKLEILDPADELFRTNPANKVRFAPLAKSTLSTRLRNLDRSATQGFMDRGVWTLYLGVGLLEWEEPTTGEGSEKTYSPLLLVPVKVKRESAHEPFQILPTDEEQRFNPALSAKFEEDFDFKLDLSSDEEDLEPDALFRSIEQQVKRKGWKVLERTVLSTFSFHKEPILRDLQRNQAVVLQSKIVQGVGAPGECRVSFEFDPIDENEMDVAAPPEKTVAILDADASQRKAIAAAGAGRSFVMDGPPGTGKSQTIANIIAELLAQQKKVLFVSDKAAALDVVFDRLDEAGLSDFVLELHSHKTTRKEVAKALGKSLKTQVRSEASMSDGDRELLRRKREELSGYALALNEPRFPLGQSLQQVIGRIAGLQTHPQAPPPTIGVAALDHALWATLSELADALGRAWGPVARAAAFLWRDLVPGEWNARRRVVLTGHLEVAQTRLATLMTVAESVASHLALPAPLSPAGAVRLNSIEKLLIARRYSHALWLSAEHVAPIRARLSEAAAASGHLRAAGERLSHEVGAGWERLPSDGSATLGALLSAANRSCEGLALGDESTTIELDGRRKALVAARTILRDCLKDTAVLATTFELDSGAISFRRSLELAQLASLSSSSDPPEATWFTIPTVSKARAAIGTLRPLLAAVQEKASQLREVFRPEVLDLDLETLAVRFETVYRGILKWVRSDFRKDRRLLMAVSRSGRLRRLERDCLRQALAWQAAARAFSAAASQVAPVLGRFLHGETTDLDAAERACKVAELAIELANSEVRAEVMARQLSSTATPSPDLPQAALRLGALRPRWDAASVQWAGLDEPVLLKAIEATTLIEAEISRLSDALAVVGSAAGRSVRLGDAIRWLDLRRQYEEVTRSFADAMEQDTSLFGPAWKGAASDWGRIDEGLSWAESVRIGLLGAVSQTCADRLCTVSATEPQLSGPISEWEESAEVIATQFELDAALGVRRQLGGSAPQVSDLLVRLRDTIDDIGEWYAHVRAVSELQEQGLHEAVEFSLSKKLKAEAVRPVLERALLEGWADEILEKDARLRTFRADDRDALTKDFRKRDRRSIQMAARQSIEACMRQRPTNFQGVASIILNEAEKQKKHMPVRELMKKAREVIQAVKPCFMMSPLSVSQFLPPELTFDVVIFDEASQVRPADAISSIYRGRQLVVAGDQKQLPPTSFFEHGDDDGDEYEEGQEQIYDSVLDNCKGSGAFPSLPLRWHYRSQHEHLIAYSNQRFYDGTLITFPGSTGNGADLGVEVFHCEGVYRRGGQRDNPIEAQLVGERVLFHAKAHPDLSIGVVAFSEAQASAIDAVIEKLSDTNPELSSLRSEDRLHGLFVKNLETVQGDERDVIIFSMGYGKDEAGRFTMNFGPLGKPGGDRRLNVAITRARRKVEFVTSVKSSEFAPNLAADGSRHLRNYLEFAERQDDRMAVLAIPLNPSLGDLESPFEAEVARAIRSWGYEIVPQVGCSAYRVDIGVCDRARPGSFVLGVECDGAMYHSSRVARDRDRLRQEVLERLGWRLHRIWGPSWYRHRAEQEGRLRQAIEGAMTTLRFDRPATHRAERVRAAEVETTILDPTGRPAWAVAYKSASLPRPRGNYDMHEPEAEDDLKRLILAVVGAESPVHEERILRRAREAFQTERAGNRIRGAFDNAVLRARAAEPRLRQRSGFMWLEGEPLAVRRPNPQDQNSERPISEVSPLELELAVLKTVGDALRIDRSAVKAYVARLFGWDRTGTRIDNALKNAISNLLRRQAIVADDDALLPAPRGFA